MGLVAPQAPAKEGENPQEVKVSEGEQLRDAYKKLQTQRRDDYTKQNDIEKAKQESEEEDV